MRRTATTTRRLPRTPRVLASALPALVAYARPALDDQRGPLDAERTDMIAARARILQILAPDGAEHGLPWPPDKESGNDR